MSSRFPTALALLPLLACAPKRWVNPAITDPQQVEKDRYACMKENSFVAGQVDSGRAGLRADQVTKVDPALFEACMRARGYASERGRERRPDRQRWLVRPARSEGLVFEADLGMGGSWSQEQRVSADYTALITDASANPVITSDTALTAPAAPMARLGVVARPSPRLDVGGRVGVRSAQSQTYVGCEAGDTTAEGDLEEVCGQGFFDSGVGFEVAAGARLRPTSAPRLFAGAELGAATAAPAPTVEGAVTVYDSSMTEPVNTQLSVGSEPTALVPFLRLGLGADLIHPDPLGLALGCSAELALRPRALAGEPEDGQGVTASCAITVRLSPGSQVRP